MLTIEKLREKIEKTDAIIIEKLAERDALSKKIGQLKAKEGKEITDVLREEKLFEFYKYLCERYKLPHTFIKRLFKIIILHSKKIQKP